MHDKAKKREAIKAYKEQEEVGGLYRYINRQTGWEGPVCTTANLQGIHNRFEFAKRTGSCSEGQLREQWAAWGPEALELVTVEKLTKKPEQTTADFQEELKALLKLYTQAQ